MQGWMQSFGKSQRWVHLVPIAALVVAVSSAPALAQLGPLGPMRPPSQPGKNQPSPAPTSIRPQAPDEEIPGALPATPFSDLSFADALDLSVRQRRVLLVLDTTQDPVAPPVARMEWHQNLAVRAWIHWHAILIKGDAAAVALIKQAAGRRRNPPFANAYNLAIIIDGKLAPNTPFVHPYAELHSVMRRQKYDFPTGLGALFAFDYVLEAKMARDPLFAEAHRRLNPPPPEPDRPSALYPRDDGLAMPVTDRPPEPGRRARVIDRVLEARRLADLGDDFGSAGLLCWLWERGAELDGDFASARLEAVARLMERTARESGPRQRYELLLERSVARVPWMKPAELYALWRLCEATGQAGRGLSMFDELWGDVDAGAMTPQNELLAMRLVFEALDLRARPVEAALAWLARQRAALSRARPAGADPEPWTLLVETRRWLVLHESAAAFARLLEAGRDDEARQVLEHARATLGSDPVRQFAMTAAAVGQWRPWLVATLAEDDPLRGEMSRLP